MLIQLTPKLRGLAIIWALFAVVELAPAAETKGEKPNIVLILSDDLACTLGCYGHPLAKTPHLDALARRGVVFERAYCQFPHCNPSRSSLLSGRRPNATRVTNNGDSLYVNLPNVTTLPRLFRDKGYATARCGKIFHLGVPTGNESMDDPLAWDFGTPFKDERPYPPSRKRGATAEKTKADRLAGQEILATDDELCDGDFAKTAIQWLEKRDAAEPFFLAVGFHRPHLPLVAPAKYFDLYPLEAVTLPKEPADDELDIPVPARNGGVPGYELTTTPEERRAVIRAYLAAVSYMDAQAGRVLDALGRLGVEGNTIVVFASDHGWHLGEHGLWHKRSLFEQCARVPLIVYVPGAKGNGGRSNSLVELLDIYPTLCDLAGVPSPLVLEGKSLRPLIADPRATLHEAAFTQARRGPNAENWGRSVRTARWRYTEWDEGRNGIELYDHDVDPNEYTNLGGDPRYAATRQELRTLLAKPNGTVRQD